MAPSSGNAPLRPLLPRSNEPPPFRPPLPVPLAKKRKAVSVACDKCRKRKIRCDANRPKCSACTSGNQECTYTINPEDSRLNLLKRRHIELETQIQQLQSSHHDLERFVQALKHLDDNAASAVIQQLRQGMNITELARDVDAGSLLIQLSHRPTLTNQDNKAEPRDSVASSSEQANKQPTALTQDQSPAVGSPYEELFDLLRTASNQEAMEILHWIKQGHSIHTTLRKAKEVDPVAQLSLIPETRRKYLFPHRSYFPHFLKISENPYLHSNSYKAAFRDISPLRTNLEASKKQSIVNQPLYTTPFHAAKMVDPYLWNVKASRWTSVTDDDQLVSELLNSYFLHQYTAYLVFHKDYFLEDLAKGRTRFCSPLLVNAILAAACHASTRIPDRAKFWRPQNLAYQFLAEARRLWDMQHGKCSLTAIQAAIVLTIICNCDTLDKIGASYFLQAVAMAHDLKLFQSPPERSISKKAQRAREFTAWSLFVWDSMTSFHYHRSPLYDQPPEFPLPSLDEDPSWYSEIYVRYPLQSNIIPIGFGSYMNAWVKLHTITHDVARHYWGVTNGPFNDPLILRRWLDEWLHGLPERLSVENIILPMHLRIHLEYQCIRVELMRAETSSMPIPHSKPTSNLTQRDNDEVRRSYVYIETLIRLYYVHHNLEIFDPFMVILLVMLGNHVVEMLKDPTTIEDDAQLYRSTLILCARGLHAQGKSIYVGTMLYLMLSNAMEMHDKTLLKTYIHDDMSHDEDSLAQYNQSDFPVPIIKINEDRRTALLGDLVKAYETLSLDEDTASLQSSTLESP